MADSATIGLKESNNVFEIIKSSQLSSPLEFHDEKIAEPGILLHDTPTKLLGSNTETIEFEIRNRNKNHLNNFNIEDSGRFLQKTFQAKNIFINENWDEIQNIQCKVIDKNNTSVTLDCLIDTETSLFQCRSFPLGLFSNIEISVGKLILIKTSIKAGSTRLDIYPGEGLVDEEYFSMEENWESLKNSGLDNKLTEWLD